MILKFGKRRLLKGNSSYVLPIPPEWIISMGLGKGDALNIDLMEDNCLRISIGQGENKSGKDLIPEARQDSTGIRSATPVN